MLGLHPFDAHMPRRARAPASTPRSSAHVTLSSSDVHEVSVAPPTGFAIIDGSASPLGDGSILVEGKLQHAHSDNMIDYVIRSSRAAIYAHPSRASLVGYVQPGTIVRGSPPSHGGWIALDDDECFMLDDGSLAARTRPSAATPFQQRVNLPADACLSKATMHDSAAPRVGERRQFKCVFSPRVAIRSGTHTAAGILGAINVGETIEGCVDDVDQNWVRLTGQGGTGYVMIQHPKLGALLRPVDRPASRDGGFVVRIPRRAMPRPAAAAKRSATQPAPAPARAPTARGGDPAKRPTSAAAATSSSAGAAEASARADLAAARRAEKRSKGPGAHGGASAVEALSGETLSVLVECPASPENVQSPKENVEAWVAVEGGGFAPVASA